MKKDNFKIRVANRDEIEIAVDWAAQEGWNPGLSDAECFFRADSQGFLIGYLDDQPVATISVVKYGDSFGFFGFYIVAPEFRGKGYGLKIWQAGIEHLNGRNIGLDGVVEQQDNYKKSGFKLAYRNIRYAGVSKSDKADRSNIKFLDDSMLTSLSEYDRRFFPAPREAFLQGWIEQPGATALGIFAGNVLCGYGVIRPCRDGYKIGPLFADSPDLAESLFLALNSAVGDGKTVFLDIPEVNPNALNLVKRNNMEVVFETARMYNKSQPTLALEQLYGVTSFELG